MCDFSSCPAWLAYLIQCQSKVHLRLLVCWGGCHLLHNCTFLCKQGYVVCRNISLGTSFAVLIPCSYILLNAAQFVVLKAHLKGEAEIFHLSLSIQSLEDWGILDGAQGPAAKPLPEHAHIVFVQSRPHMLMVIFWHLDCLLVAWRCVISSPWPFW